ncbi:hypothetical protein, conserved [Trypanosoma brucei gambiense DAL972]|uniref:Uncharacterized protein n=1 Tax=Trypanosoma brucei gambiense (strain MHOM/CI/86/DAL972) TaxID=679716 RepID=D0A8M2_TRYB9|nr:hypothetical protein, conserved [Trypanosoma brucei gambiense DAL972]CBH18023.1 hypothetical protein, conserved [Trypanosoma brucei gambiense DAL972]|eukprot:XP_011780287.1 hypothetical protein, conserved [Trypanosoma brucei gambiense DAL972]
MLRRTVCVQHYRAKLELDRIRSMLRGRARLERKVGLKRLFFLMRTQTRYRVEQQAHWERAIVRKNVDSAAREHGTGWQHLRNELGRQNVILLPRSQQLLAQYEPLAFRAVVELCASRIPPPPPPVVASVPEESYTLWPPASHDNSECASTDGSDAPHGQQQSLSHPAARVELRCGVERVLRRGPSGLGNNVNELIDAWKEFDVSPLRKGEVNK